MKRFFLIVALMVSIISISAEPLIGFWGIRFGSSIRETETILNSKGINQIFRKGDGAGEYMFIENVDFAGRNTDITLYFFNDLFYMSFVKIGTDGYHLFEEYESIKRDLNSKYGAPAKEVEEYKYPYKKGDGDEIMAVRMNAVNIYTIWNFDLKNGILVIPGYDKASGSYQVLLSYRDGIIYEQNKKESNVLNDL